MEFLSSPSFSVTFALHTTINMFWKYTLSSFWGIFEANCDISKLPLFSPISPITPFCICCPFSLQYPKFWLCRHLEGETGNANWLQIVYIIILTAESCSYSVWNNDQNQLQTYRLWGLFIIVMRWFTNYCALFMKAGTCFFLKILSFKGHIKFQTCFSAP